MNKLWLIRWKEGGQKIELVTPLLSRKGAALLWLLEQRPYLLQRLAEIEVIPFIRSKL